MYRFFTDPYPHQKKVFEETKDKKVWALNLEMGLGKSKIALDTASYLFQKGEITLCLIFSPKGVYDTWCRNEIPSHVSPDLSYEILRWQSNETKAYKKKMVDCLTPENKRERTLIFFVMNIEALSTDRGKHYALESVRLYPDNLVIVDESTTIKTHNSRRTKSVLEISKFSKFRRTLTGSPITNSPLDLWSQFEFLDPAILGEKNYYSYEQKYTIKENVKIKNRYFRKIVGYRDLSPITEKIKPSSTRLLKEDCLNLPEKVYLKRYVELTPQQEKAYSEVKRRGLTQLESGELLTTQSVLGIILRLQQIGCGFFKPDDSDKVLPLKSNRLNELHNVLEETEGKVLIWSSLVPCIEEIVGSLEKKYGPKSVEGFYGATPQKFRQDIIDRFQDPDDPLKYFVSNPATGAFGITLTAARTAIYYSNSYNYEHRLQSEARAHRISQKFMLSIIDLCATIRGKKTIDEKILSVLKGKQAMSAQVLDEEVRTWLS